MIDKQTILYLISHDNVPTRELLTEILTDEGFAVIATNLITMSVEERQALFHEQAIDRALIQIPPDYEANWLRVQQALNVWQERGPIIYLGTNAEKIRAAAGNETTSVLQEPFYVDTILELIEEQASRRGGESLGMKGIPPGRGERMF